MVRIRTIQPGALSSFLSNVTAGARLIHSRYHTNADGSGLIRLWAVASSRIFYSSSKKRALLVD